MKARINQSVSQGLRNNKYFMDELEKDGWEIKRNRGILDIDIPCRLKEGECLSFTTYWGDIESGCYNARLGMLEYEFVLDRDSLEE